MKKRTHKHSKSAGSRGRGRPAMSGNVHIEPVHAANLDLTKLAHALEQYWNCLGSQDVTKAASQDNIRLERDKIMRKQKKLLEVHYDDSIPLEIFKEE